MSQAACTVLRMASGSRLEVLAVPLRWPKYTLMPRPLSCWYSTVSTSRMRTETLMPSDRVNPASAELAPSRQA